MTCAHINTCKEHFLEEKATHRKALYKQIKGKPDIPQTIYREASIEYVSSTYRWIEIHAMSKVNIISRFFETTSRSTNDEI